MIGPPRDFGVDVRVPAHLVAEPTEALEFLTAHWAGDLERTPTDDGGAVLSHFGEYPGGVDNVIEACRLDDLAADGCDWVVHDASSLWQADPCRTASVDGMVFTVPLGGGSEPVLSVNASRAEFMVLADMLTEMALQYAHHVLLSERFGHDIIRRPAVSGELAELVSLVLDPPSELPDGWLRVRMLLANRHLTPGLLAELLERDGVEVVLPIAGHPRADVGLMRVLLDYDDDRVSQAVASVIAGRRDAPGDVLEVIARRHGTDRWIADRLLDNRALTHAAARHLPAAGVVQRRPELAVPAGGPDAGAPDLPADLVPGCTLGELLDLQDAPGSDEVH